MNGHAHLNGNMNGHVADGHRPAKWAYLAKLLYPGVGIKRWLFSGAVGISLLSIGIAVVLRKMLEIGLPDFMPFNLEGVFFILFGMTILGLSAYGLFRTIGPIILSHKTIDNIANSIYTRRSLGKGPRIVVIGGGTGLGVLLRGLKAYTDNITAIVTVGDDGGSSGRLRDELGVLPPGDFRNCLVALSESETLVTKLFQYRFDEGNGLKGHSFGNLFIVAMSEITNSFESALQESSRVLAVHGQILPSTIANIQLSAELKSGERVDGESSITARGDEINRMFIEPQNAEAYPLAVQAIKEAQMIVIGPGSLYTSILPNLLVEGICGAVVDSSVPKVYISNVATEQGETEGYSVSDHLAALQRHTSMNIVNYVIANSNPIEPGPNFFGKPVVYEGQSMGDVNVELADIADPNHPVRHDSKKLAQVIMDVYHRERKQHKNRVPASVHRNGTA
jgi:uncharacterized cofD-like protein